MRGADSAGSRDSRPCSAEVVVLSGHLGADRAAELERSLTSALPSGPAPRLVVDLARITGIAPACVDVMLAVHAELEARGGGLDLRRPPAAVVLMFHEVPLDGDPPPRITPDG